MIHDQEKSSRTRRRSVSPNGMDNGHDAESFYQQHQQPQQQNGNYHHQSSRNSINHQDVVMSHESPYSKDVADMSEENGIGHHTINGTSSKYSLLQFAAQHFRNE